MPIEYWQPEFDVIRWATAQGIVVVEAAGNGSQNLDDAVYGRRFDRAHRDSGAILVGAGTAGPQHRRLHFSNCGDRVDVQAWGERVATTGGNREIGYDDLVTHVDGARCYTKSFSGTSSASAIVASVAAAINGRLCHLGRAPLDSVAMRDLLRATGTEQHDRSVARAADEPIGPLPDLRAALRRLGAA